MSSQLRIPESILKNLRNKDKKVDNMMTEKDTRRKEADTKNMLTPLILLIQSRLEALFIWSWNTCIACMIAGKGSPPPIPTIRSVTAVMFITLSVYLYNDFTDVNIDRLSSIKMNRPLPAGSASQKDMMRVVCLSGSIGLIIALFGGIYSFLFSFTYLALFMIYSHPRIRLKRRFLFKEVVIALGIPLTSLVGIYAVANSFVAHAFSASICFAIFTYMAQPLFTDSIDVEEDLLAGVRSLATILVWKRRIQLLVLGSLLSMACAFIMYRAFDYNIVLPIYAVGGGSIFLLLVTSLLNNYEEVLFRRARKITYIYFVFLQIFFIIGSPHLQFF
jgi:4-hydroxybenzoate polyprenyltransferase